MTTTIIVHNGHRTVTIKESDRAYDHDAKKLTDNWKETNRIVVQPGQLFQTYCTDTRRVEIVEESTPGD